MAKLTDSEIDALEAGSKIDFLIARDVMKSVSFHAFGNGGVTYWGRGDRHGMICDMCDEWVEHDRQNHPCTRTNKRYSADYAAALEAVNELGRVHFTLVMDGDPSDWRCDIERDDDVIHKSYATTPPLAICRSLLKVVNG